MENKSPIKSNNAAIESRVTGILEVLDINIAVLDHSGIIIATNQSWLKFAANNCAADGSLPHNIGEGSNYLEICRNAFGPSAEGALVDRSINIITNHAISKSNFFQRNTTGAAFISAMPSRIRALSSVTEATRMWPRKVRAIFEKAHSIRLSQEPCLGV